jgi:1-aminocyclopropane-1-carboxylate deaminase/D-cysteine desulfhydrase-like pyridoxal-dependent ACC family enzyme
MDADSLRAALNRFPRAPLAHLPTPLEECPRLSEAVGGARIWMKRDDATGLAFGGNKTRQLELTLGEALARGADCIVQGAGSQSNHCRQTAAACARLGLDCVLCLRRDAKSAVAQGNLLLDHLFGAEVRFVDCDLGPAHEEAKSAVGEELRARGRRPYVIGEPRGKILGAAAYVGMALELAAQLAELNLQPDFLYVCSAGPTGSGVLLGARALGFGFPTICVAPIRWPYDTAAAMAATATSAAREMGLPIEFDRSDVQLDEEHVGPAYGIVTNAAQEALRLAARTEGILLDPVYTAKAMAGLISDVRRGRVPAGSNVVFVHTGGTPALFAYADEILAG